MATHDDVKDYYGKQLTGNKSLATSVCTMSAGSMPKYMAEARKLIHTDVADRFYGCGLIAPECLDGATVLDLGSGSGLDVFVLSKLVGETGNIVGVDMTQEQLDVATKYIGYHTEKFGYKTPNVRFINGYIEKLTESGLEENYFDIIVSNCVVNLVPDKRAVMRETLKVLKTGGEFYFSDIYTDRVLSDELRKHKLLWGECISGAMFWEEFIELAKEEGFSVPYLVSAGLMDIAVPELITLLGDAKFVSAEYRLFKLPKKSEWLPAAELIYNGQISHVGDEFVFDHQTTFKKDIPYPADSQLVTSIMTSRYKQYFTDSPLDGDTAPEEKVAINVIEYCEKIGAKSSCCAPSKTTGGGCCVPKAKSKESTNGCCPAKESTNGCCPSESSANECSPKIESTGGCCPKSPSTECCPEKRPSEASEGCPANATEGNDCKKSKCC